MREIFRSITGANMGDVYKSSQLKTLCLSFIRQAFDDFQKDAGAEARVRDAFGAMEILAAARGNPTALFPEYFSTALKRYRIAFPDALYEEALRILQIIQKRPAGIRDPMELKEYMGDIEAKLKQKQ